MKKITKIIEKLESGEITGSDALTLLVEEGFCPNLLNDDNGHWALCFDGFQNIPMGDDAEDISSTIFVEKSLWKDTIDEAIIHALKEEE